MMCVRSTRVRSVNVHRKYGTEDGARTRDIEFGKLALCLLSYIRKFQSE